jgi:uncharacterized caspase-like protein
MPGRDAAGADMAAVYFAGRGMEISGENWLIPVDAELKRETSQFYSEWRAIKSNTCRKTA